jgi:carbonic anhydrase/acetyltransferase-like protein (isoleucine patch superfamily)
MGAIVLNGAVIGSGSLVAAGAVVVEGAQIPPGSVVVGIPGRVAKPVDAETRKRIEEGADAYLDLMRRHQHKEFPEHH